METDYSNRELDAKFEGIHEKLDLILAQTTKTNGRVTTLEYWKEGMVGRVVGGIAVIGILWEVLLRFLFK